MPLAGIGKPSSEKPAIEPEAAGPAAPMLEQKTEAPVVEVETVPPSRRSSAPEPAKPEPVIPLVHAPDDPGPEAESIEETVARVEAQASGWRKMVE